MTLRPGKKGERKVPTELERELMSAVRRFPPHSPEEHAYLLLYWIAKDAIRWTPELLAAVREHAAKQGIS
jgi:hypothetical protein